MAEHARSLFDAVAQRLSPSPERKIEALRWRAARGEAPETALSPALLARLTEEDDAWAARAFADLMQCGFIQAQLTAYAWANLDALSIRLEFDVLSSIEAIVALRFGYADCSGALVAVKRQLALITEAAAEGDALGVTLETQRLLLGIIAAVDGGELFREYAAYARPSLAYAWACQLTKTDLPALVAMVCDIAANLEAGRGKAAADLIIALRRLPESVGRPSPLALKL